MTEPAPARLPLCCHLRFCGAGAEAEGVPQGPLPDCDEGHFLCALTISHVGPDARIADSESCRPGRDCYAPPARAGAAVRRASSPVTRRRAARRSPARRAPGC